jgi:hypothetical protein
MANFNGLRSPRTSPAGAGRLALAAPPAPLLLALFAALAAAFLISQLSGSAGTAEPPRFPAFLTEALGAPQAEAPLTRKPAQGVSVAIRDDGYGVTAKDGSVSLASKEAGEGQWRGFANGTTRPTSFGAETIVVEPRKTEQYLTVTRHQGLRTWTWKLATTLEPRLAADGGVDFVIDGGWHQAHKHFHGPRLAQYRIAPVAILDAQGNDVTPAGLRWSLAHRGSSWRLELRLDDSSLPLPYVIDPAITLRGSVGSSNGGEATLVMTMPSGVVANDFLIAMVTVRGGTVTTITPPAGWTPLRRDDNGTSLGQAIYYKVAGSSEPVSYTWNVAPAIRASGGIIAYTGVDNADPFDVVGSDGGNSSLVIAPTITTSENNAMIVAFYGIANCNNGGDYWTPPLGMAERIDINSTGSFPNRSNSGAADVVQALAGPTGPKTATASSSGAWIAQLVALRLDVTPPAAPVQTITESTAASHASGSTFYYRPAGAGGSFTVAATTNDGTPTQSGLNKVNLPGLAGGFTPTTGLDDTASPYEQTYSWTTGSTENGAKTVTATDNAGNTNTGTFTITPDSTAPTTTDNTASIGSGWKNSNQIVALTPSDGSGSGAATTYYTTDGSIPTTASPQGTSVSLTSDGSYTIKYFSVDNVGNSESPVTAGTVINIDKTNPTSATLDPLPAAIRNGQVLTGAATDGGPSGIASISYYYCAGPPCTPSTLIGSSSTGPSYSVTWSSQPADGDYEVLARASDNAGNTLDSAKRTVTVDNTAPNTSITASPSDPSNDPNPSFSFSSSEGGSSFQCQLDAGGWSACTSPKSHSGLSAGSHTFEVRATDAAGNTDASPASYPWTIDLTAPNTSLMVSPSDPSNDANPSFSFDSSEASTFECKLDAGSFASCTSPKSYAGLSAGSHTFEVRATDAAGNPDATPATHTWTIDLTDPNTSITTSPSDPSNDANPSFSFDSSEAGTFECKLDAGSFAACTSPKSYSGLAAGSHTFEVRAIDLAGNTDGSPATHTWTIDLTAPNTSLTVSPSDPSNDANPSFSFDSSEGGSSFQCQLDAGGWSACTSPKSYSGLSAGSHTFEVRATDAAENTDATPATHIWTIDLSAPDTTITGQPGNPSNDMSPTFAFSASETGTFECELDGGGFQLCASPRTYAGPLADGPHTFQVRATDAAGNTDATPASFGWTIDSAAPATTIDAAPSDPSNDSSPTFQFSSSEAGSSFECELDGGGFQSCASPHTYAGPLADGPHTFRVRATDPAGNTDATPAAHSWTVNASAPSVTITSPSGFVNASASDPFTVTATSLDADLVGVEFFRCTDASSDCSTGSWVSLGTDNSEPYTASWPLPGDGNAALRAVATDVALSTGSHTANVMVDRVLPVTTIGPAPSDPSASAGASFTFAAGESGVSFECRLDGGAFAACTSPLSYSGLVDGSHTFDVRATDPAGNVGPADSHTWTVDTVVPETTLTSTPSDPTSSAAPSFSFTASEAGSSFACELDGGGFSPCTSPKSYAGLADGSHTFRVRATDAAGNMDASPAMHTWTIDATPPGGGLADPGSPLRLTPTLSAAPSDAGAGVQEVRFEYSPANAGSWTAIATDTTAPYSASWDTTATGDGLYDLRIVVTDNALNATTSAEVEDRRVDNTAPMATMDDPGAYLRATVSLTSVASDLGSGVASVTYERSPAGAGSWSAVPASWDTTGAADGPYDLRVLVADTAGNTTTSAPVTDRRVDNTAPTVASSSPVDGALVASAGSLAIVASEDVVGIQNATFDGVPAPAPVVVGTTVTYTAAFADGPHTLAGELEDLAGNQRPIRIHFTVWSLATADYPYIEKNWLAGLSAALAATNGTAELDAPANGWTAGAIGDWLVLRVDPRPPTQVGNGFELNGDILDVTAYWALAGGDVHSFLLPIHIVMRNGAANALPMTLENGAWRGIASVSSGQTLPGSWQDGFYRVGSDVHILTRHLSSFTLLKDVKGPSAPGSFRGARTSGQLVLSWAAASDNSGLVDGYVVYANGTELRALGAGARSVDIGAFKVSDKRKFQVAARDAAGNLGAKTHQLVIVPNLRGATLAKAKAKLAARGLKPGKIRRIRSTRVPAGRILKTGRSGVLPTGSKVALTVSIGGSGTGASGSTGGSGSGGRGSTGGTSAGGSAPSGSVTPPSAGVTPPSLVPSTPSAAPEVPAAGEAGQDARPTVSVAPTSSSSTNGKLRHALGLALLSAAFMAALLAWWRLRRLPAWQSPAAEPTEIVFWDQRLTRLALATVRRVAGRA